MREELGVKKGQLYHTDADCRWVWIHGKLYLHPKWCFKILSNTEAVIELGKQKAKELP